MGGWLRRAKGAICYSSLEWIGPPPSSSPRFISASLAPFFFFSPLFQRRHPPPPPPPQLSLRRSLGPLQGISMAQRRAVTSKCHPGETRALPSFLFFHSATRLPLSYPGEGVFLFGISTPSTSKRREQSSPPVICHFRRSLINGGHKPHRLSPVLRGSMQGRRRASQGFHVLSPTSLIWFLKGESSHHPVRASPSFPRCLKHALKKKHSTATLPSCKPPPAAGFLTTGQPCIHCEAGPQKEPPSEGAGRRPALMLRDRPRLFKGQRSNDSR